MTLVAFDPLAVDPAVADPQVAEDVATEERVDTPWRVILYDDDSHTFEEFIVQLVKATGCSEQDAERHAPRGEQCHRGPHCDADLMRAFSLLAARQRQKRDAECFDEACRRQPARERERRDR